MAAGCVSRLSSRPHQRLPGSQLPLTAVAGGRTWWPLPAGTRPASTWPPRRRPTCRAGRGRAGRPGYRIRHWHPPTGYAHGRPAKAQWALLALRPRPAARRGLQLAEDAGALLGEFVVANELPLVQVGQLLEPVGDRSCRGGVGAW